MAVTHSEPRSLCERTCLYTLGSLSLVISILHLVQTPIAVHYESISHASISSSGYGWTLIHSKPRSLANGSLVDLSSKILGTKLKGIRIGNQDIEDQCAAEWMAESEVENLPKFTSHKFCC